MTVKLVELKTYSTEVQENIVETLTDLLERAKKNEFTGFAWTATKLNGEYKTGYTKGTEFPTLICGASTLQHRMIAGHLEMSRAED